MRSQDGKHCTEEKKKGKKKEDQTSFLTEFGTHGDETQKKQTIKHYKSQFSNTQKNFLYVVLSLLKFKDDL